MKKILGLIFCCSLLILTACALTPAEYTPEIKIKYQCIDGTVQDQLRWCPPTESKAEIQEETIKQEPTLKEIITEKNNNLEVKINSHYSTPFLPGYEDVEVANPEEGFEYYVIDITVHNQGNDNIDSMSFKLKDEEGYTYGNDIITTFSDQFYAKIPPNDFSRGKIQFSVRKGANLKKLLIVYVTDNFDVKDFSMDYNI